MRKIVLAVWLLYMTTAAAPASAALVVDTGQPTSCCLDFGRSNNNFGDAARFTLGETLFIESVETFLRSGDPNVDWTDPTFAGGGEQTPTLVVGIFADDRGSVPGTLMFSTSNRILRNFDDWFGAYGLSLTLAAGSYWAGFWVPDSDNPSFLDIWRAPPDPATAYAESWYGGTNWFSSSAATIGLRINGSATESSVPEPASFAILSLGLIGIGLSQRRRIQR